MFNGARGCFLGECWRLAKKLELLLIFKNSGIKVCLVKLEGRFIWIL